MASHQATKKDSKMEETKQTHHSQEPKVLKLAQHFEELGKDSDESGGQKGEQERAQIDLNEIGKYRQQAQQNSMEALMGADEKYQKAKNASLGELLKDAKQAPGGAGEPTHTRTPEITGGPSVKERAGELAWRGGDEQGEEKTKQGHGGGGAGKDMPTRSHETTGYSVKDRAGELTGRRGDEQGKEEAKEAALGELLKDAKQPGEQGVGGGSGKKDTRETTSHFVKDKVGEFTGRQGDKEGSDQGQGGKEETAGEGEEYVDAPAGEEAEHLEGQKGSDYTTAAKDTIVTVGKTVIDYTKHAAEQARDVAANTGGPTIHYIGEKAAGVKDTAVNVSKTAAGTTADIGKSAAGYAGTKVVQAKDVVVETGLRAAHYTLQKAVQVTEATADVGHKAVEYTGEKTEEAKQEKVQKAEEAQQYAAEAKADVQESKPSQGKDEPKYDDYKEVAGGSYSEEPHTEKQGGSFMGAVGEALSEIAQTTKKMVMVKDPDQKE